MHVKNYLLLATAGATVFSGAALVSAPASVVPAPTPSPSAVPPGQEQTGQQGPSAFWVGDTRLVIKNGTGAAFDIRSTHNKVLITTLQPGHQWEATGSTGSSWDLQDVDVLIAVDGQNKLRVGANNNTAYAPGWRVKWQTSNTKTDKRDGDPEINQAETVSPTGDCSWWVWRGPDIHRDYYANTKNFEIQLRKIPTLEYNEGVRPSGAPAATQ